MVPVMTGKVIEKLNKREPTNRLELDYSMARVLVTLPPVPRHKDIKPVFLSAIKTYQ